MKTTLAHMATTIFIVIVVASSLAGAHGAQADEPVRSITVQGVGMISAAPDMAVVAAGALTRSTTAANALADNNAALAKVFQLVQDMRIDMRDVQTSGFSLNPIYERRSRSDANNTNPPAITGYQATNNVSIKIRNINLLGEFLDKLASEGANQIRGISFGLSERQSLLDQARQRAVANARAKAELYATEAGISLGNVIEIVEAGGVAPRAFRAEAAMLKSGAAVPVATGTLELRANITMRFAISDAD